MEHPVEELIGRYTTHVNPRIPWERPLGRPLGLTHRMGRLMGDLTRRGVIHGLCPMGQKKSHGNRSWDTTHAI